jgi:polyisoprenoid-binding protein YceI
MATAVQTADGIYDLDKAHSTVQFAIRHVGVSSFRASFGDVEARLRIDDGAVELQASALVESISIVDPPEFREHVVHGDDFFAAGVHPVLTFSSTSIDIADDGTLNVSGDLVVRGVSTPVDATGTFSPPTEDPFGRVRVGLELEATIDRRSWGMDWQLPLPGGGDALGWEVAITGHLELTRIP